MQCVRKIVCLGDSLTYGYPYGLEASWVNYVSRNSSFELVNAGVNGDTLEDMVGRYERDVRRHRPDAVVILGGTNDAHCSEISCDQAIYCLGKIIASALKDGIRPVVATPIPVADDDAVNAKLQRIVSDARRLSEELRLSLLDFAAPFYNGQGAIREELYIDGVHPNRDGYEVMGKTALNFFLHYFQR
ncbi:MAG: acyl-CoA thioesterase [Thermacetogenium sp.]|jgi:lysophospholipase L1-like esterase|uniref:Lipolytic enzyme G-D-S-L family n=1 Tax=Thermacetogenium phaeum TaxID=85874 RepID=A0A101FGB1_9THEO|nr:MAG: Lipolytic enzyme G-D-S-L family [Thermacetogenium phaeum]MDN5365882.1 acyl-CoA thioesterase [Thermacetogenium sp.]